MKKTIILIASCFLFLGLNINVYANYDFGEYPTIPFTYNNITYEDVVTFSNNWNKMVLYVRGYSEATQTVDGSVLFYCDNPTWNNCAYNMQNPAQGFSPLLNVGVPQLHSSQTFQTYRNYTVDIFQQSTFTLTVATEPSVGGYVMSYPNPNQIYCPYDAGDDDCEEVLQTDSQITLEAYENTGYVFDHWDDGSTCYESNPITITMSSDVSLEAVYVPVLEFPLSGTLSSRTIMSDFGDDWITYCDGEIKLHTGIDIQATANEEVSIAESGKIKLIFEDTSQYQWGWCVVIEHDDGSYTTTYWHLNDPRSSEIYVGADVVKGYFLGTVKNMSANTHLHFGVRMHAYTADNVPNAGALPQTPNCGGYPAYPEFFINPENLVYE